MMLEQFNGVSRSEATDVLRPCLDVRRWYDELADGRPYPTLDALLEAARAAAQPFTPDELEAALAHHPRIGQRHGGTGAEATMSASEQSSVDQTDAAVADALAVGNRAYEEKFGRVFLIRAAGRSAPEILASLQKRLQHSAADEDEVAAEQLRQIALLRLTGVITA